MVSLATFQRNHHRNENDTCSLPFVCRLEDATKHKPKQNLTQCGKIAKPVNARRRMKRQQSATASKHMAALC
jgi:hypothetical protein